MKDNLSQLFGESAPRRLRHFGLSLAACLMAVSCLASAASADFTFGSTGTGSGQFDSRPEGAAIDDSNGHLYLADRNNNRIVVFGPDGAFLFAFGWGVADGTSAEPQTCTSTCFKGLETAGAGGFARPSSVAVDNDPGSSSYHDVYVFDQARIQKFTPSGEFISAWGGGVVTGGASGKGDLSSGATTVTNVVTNKKSFLLGQTITGAGIPPATKILAFGDGTIELSKPATASASGVLLSVAEGAGNVPVNEVQVVRFTTATYDVINFFQKTFQIAFSSPTPSPSFETTSSIPSNATAAEVQSALTALPNVGAGNVSVTSPNPGGIPGITGGPYTITFKGTRFSDTDVQALATPGTGPGRTQETIQNGASGVELCAAASAADCTSGVVGTEAGKFGRESQSIATGPNGTIYVSDTWIDESNDVETARIETFDPSGALIANMPVEGVARVNDIAVDSSGDIYIVVRSEIVRKYDSGGGLLDSLNFQEIRSIGVDSADDLFVAREEEGSRTISEFDQSGVPLRSFGYGNIGGEGLRDLVPYHTATGELFSVTAGKSEIRYWSFPPPGPISCCIEATGVGNAKAALGGKINPEGKETKYHFEYVDDKSFNEQGGFASPATKSTPEVMLAADASLHRVSAQAAVVPSTAYRFRLVAESADGKAISDPAEFTTLPPLEIGGTWSTEVGTDAAQLHAEVNPLGIPTSGYFQYVDDATFQASGFAEATDIPDVIGGASPIGLGAGESLKALTAFIYPLVPGTTYHYRVVATDPFVTVFGDPKTLTVFPLPAAPRESCPNQGFRVAASASLPDCRAFELVSPLDKGNGDIRTNPAFSNSPASLDQGSEDGNRFSFSSSTSFGGAPSDPWTSQYMAQRDPVSGWSTHAISPPRQPKSIAGAFNVNLDVQFKRFSPDLSGGWLLQDTDPPLDSCAVAGFINLYHRDDASGKYEALTTLKPQNEVPDKYFPELQGFSADETHVVFAANAKLTKDASTAISSGTSAIYQLYERISGKKGCGETRLVSVLPNGKPSTLASSAGVNDGGRGEGRFSTVQNAISADGSRIFWSTYEAQEPGALYVRIDGKETVEIAPASARFWAAAEDGSKAIFTTNLHEVPGAQVSDLYEFDVGKREKHLIAEEAFGVAAVSEDASRVYFVSRKALGGEGKAGQPNLYLYEAGAATKFIGTVAARDLVLNFRYNGLALLSPGEPGARGTRVTPDGSHFAFVSQESLTGYDNKDATDGTPATEVYLYDASEGKLACVSCNPSGGRPVGREFEGNGNAKVRVAAELSLGANQFFSARALTEDGKRLFFQSFEALVPRDTNGKQDVYEWQGTSGPEGCGEAGAELFVASSGGCLSLISSGKGPEDSQLVDMTPNGSDVFIRTASSLLPQDSGLIDIYDARANGGYPPPPAIPPACEGEACQTPPSPPNDPTPASSAFEGAGNVVEKPAKKKQKKAKKKAKKHHKSAKRASKQRANSNGRAGR
jgi:NHL repeat